MPPKKASRASRKIRNRGKKPAVTPRSRSRSWGMVDDNLPHQRPKRSAASMRMSITDLEFMAKSLGIMFGGLKKDQLVDKINHHLRK